MGCNPAACGGLKPFTVNAESVARFTSTDRDELLAQLRATLLPLLDYLRALPPEEWDDGHGVANRLGQLVTVRGEIVPLTADYAGHRLEIESWAARPGKWQASPIV